MSSQARDALGARRAFRGARIIGALLLLCAIAMMAMFPAEAGPLPRGFGSPVLAFELAASREEVEALFAQAGSHEREQLRRAMDRGNQLDFAFMVLYSALLAAVALGLARAGSPRLRMSALLAPLATAADALENVQLLAITRALGADYSEALSRLQVWTRVKWGCLALALVWLVPALYRGDRFDRGTAIVCALTGVAASAAAYQRAYFMELFALGVMLSFVGLWVVACRRS